VAPWRIQAIQYQRAGRDDAAERILVRLFKEHSDDPEALGALSGFYARRRHIDKFIALLKERHQQQPANFTVTLALAETLSDNHRNDDAAAVLDSSRSAAADDADLLYTLSGVYSRIGRKQTTEEVLQQVLKVDPAHAAAKNDLGFMWADDGRNLAQAEEFIAAAVKAEPANVSFLDSMGWVLYKRGRFTEARQYLDRAIGKRPEGEGRPGDPVVLDHRGDVLYRMGEKESAVLDWRHAAERIAALRDGADDEMKSLRARLLEKMQAVKAGKTVSVAPVVEPSSGP
jgi:predicted Zn-dependent protease